MSAALTAMAPTQPWAQGLAHHHPKEQQSSARWPESHAEASARRRQGREAFTRDIRCAASRACGSTAARGAVPRSVRNSILRYFEEAEIDVRRTGWGTPAREEERPRLAEHPGHPVSLARETEVQPTDAEQPTRTVAREDLNDLPRQGSGTRVLSTKRAVHAVVEGKKRAMCGWRFRPDTGWSVVEDDELATCRGCARSLRLRETNCRMGS